MTYDLVGIGELLWDCLPTGRVMGGAPGNVVFHARQLGLNAILASRVGNDDEGSDLLDQLQLAKLESELIQRDPERPTSQVQIQLDRNGSASYTFTENCAWDGLEATSKWKEACLTARAICFGSLAQRSPESHLAIRDCLQVSRQAQPQAHRLFDINLRAPFIVPEAIVNSLDFTTILKLNEHEWPQIATMLNANAAMTDLEAFRVEHAAFLFDHYPDIQLICISRGKEGLILTSRDEVIQVPGQPIQIADTVGAGDATSAGLIFGLLSAWPIEKTGRFANQLGGIVASHHGPTPVLPLKQLAKDFSA